MKIYHAILSGNWGGSERYMSNLANLQASKGHNVTLIVKSSKRKAHLEFFKNNHGAKIIVVPAEIRKNFSILRRLYIRMFLRLTVDTVFHCHDHQTISLLKPIADQYRIPLLCNLHTSYDPDTNGICDAIIYGNQDRAGELDAVKDRAHFIPNFIKPVATEETYAAEQIALLDRCAIKKSDFNICTVSRLSAVKEIETLIHAFIAFQSNYGVSDAGLIIAGAGEDYDRLASIARGHDKIYFTGQVTHPEAVFSLSQCYAMASPNETGIPLSTLEAAAFGLPLILSSCETHRYFYRYQETKDHITLFEPRDILQLSFYYFEYYKKYNRKLKANFSLGEFDPERANKKIDELYENLLKNLT
jgi:glycosyltransferase involved in cell wall biosynthesis